MLRLTGLPAVARFPRATVRRGPDRFELGFHGGDASTRIDVDRRYLGPDDDPESVELALLGQLQRLGYEVQRLEPEPGDDPLSGDDEPGDEAEPGDDGPED
ncbi:MAG: hypothetical protein ACRDNJ_03820 [Solirubrobacteraceae bacterium]